MVSMIPGSALCRYGISEVVMYVSATKINLLTSRDRTFKSNLLTWGFEIMKKICFLLLTSLLLMLTACGRNSALNNTDADISSPMEYSYFMEDIMRSCTNIVKAKLTSIENFSVTRGTGGFNFYCFDISEDYTGNTPDEIDMVYSVIPHLDDFYNRAYVVGHTYYLFLCADESALRPYTTYDHVIRDLAIDADDATTNTHIMDNDLVVTTSNISERIKDLISSGIVGEDLKETISISDSNDIKFISDSADIIAEIGVSSETNYNIYASSYDIKVVSVLKGSAESVSSSMDLPPNLDPSKTYYVFLKKIPNGGDGAYSLFSRAYPVIDAASVNAKDLITN
jgi:hypothetical protein